MSFFVKKLRAKVLRCGGENSQGYAGLITAGRICRFFFEREARAFQDNIHSGDKSRRGDLKEKLLDLGRGQWISYNY